jgi:hypothetical protein
MGKLEVQAPFFHNTRLRQQQLLACPKISFAS